MVRWFKDDVELISGLGCAIRLQKYSSSVELHSVGTLQCGIYSCHVSNEAGTVKSTAELSVKGWTLFFSLCPPPLPPIRSSLSLFFSFSSPASHLFPFQEYPCHLHPPFIPLILGCDFILTPSLLDVAEPPHIVLKLPPSTFVKQSDGHCLECKAESTRFLKMCWYKDDHEITNGGNYKITFVESSAYLQLLTTSFEDNGVYTCQAYNDAGSSSCSTVLTVQGQPSNRRLVVFCRFGLESTCPPVLVSMQ